MAIDCQFREKPFEKMVDWTLGRLTSYPPFGPDQVAEAALGFDAAWRLDPRTMAGLGLPIRPALPSSGGHGMSLSPSMFPGPARTGSLPPPWVKLCLFLQYKIPVRIVGHRGGEWRYWRRPYFRFSITGHQQWALANIIHHSHGLARAVYVAPTFMAIDDLITFATKNTLLDHVHFVPAERLVASRSGNPHRVYTFNEPRSRGIACSEPEEVEPVDLVEIINSDQIDGRMELEEAVQFVLKIIDSFTQTVYGPGRYYQQVTEQLLRGAVERGQFFQNMIRLYAFQLVYDTQIRFVPGEPTEPIAG